MAPNTPSRPGRALFTLAAIIVALIGTLIGGTTASKAKLTPLLALDLEGGTQLILTPKTTDNSKITEQDINQAIEIIRQRVDASGVAEAEITRQGQDNIVVALPGKSDPATLALVRQSAELRFRPVILVEAPGALNADNYRKQLQNPKSSAPSADPSQTLLSPVAPADKAKPTPGATTPPPSGQPNTPGPNATAEEIARSLADADRDGKLSDKPKAAPTSASDPNWISEKLSYDFLMHDCTKPANLVGGDHSPADQPVVACSKAGDAKYILGPSEVSGTQVKSAASGLERTATGATTNNWIVTLELTGDGAKAFKESTTRLVSQTPPRNLFAITLDGLVIQAPRVNQVIADGNAMISGAFTQPSAALLANQLNFGSLPLNFEVQSEEQISATLGFEQLERGVLAGLIGLLLVVLYMLWQYNALGFLALASLSVAALMTYLAITILGWTTGYRLSLAGVAGLIVAIGITADSFILYFERVRDEVREGRALKDAVDRGWTRARRTILASDAVSFLAAIVLYFLAVGGVRGFAFTLGLTTLVDLLVVFLFTHPMLQLLVRTRFFGEGRKFSGLDPEKLGANVATYRGRGQLKGSIAERKARAAREKEDADA